MKSAVLFSISMTIFGYALNIIPNIPVLILSVGVAILLDFGTGFIKAKMKKADRTSEGCRRTVKKLSQYLTAILLSLGIQFLIKRLVKETPDYIVMLPTGVMLFIIYIEVFSILENLFEIDNKSVISKYIFKPLLIIFKMGLEKNPVIEASKNISDKDYIAPPPPSKPGIDTVTNASAILLLITLLSGCMTDKKAQQITDAYLFKHPDKLAKECMDKYPPSLGPVKSGDTILNKVVTDTIGQAEYKHQIDELTKQLIAEKMSSPVNLVDSNELYQWLYDHIPSPVVKRYYYTRTDTLPVADSAAIKYWHYQYQACQNTINDLSNERDKWKAKYEKAKSRSRKFLILSISLILAIIVYVLRRLKII